MITYKIKNPDGPYGDLLIDGEDFAGAVTEYVSTAHYRGGDKSGIKVDVDEDGGTAYHPLRAVATIPSGNHTRQMVIYGKESRRFGRPEIGGAAHIRFGDLLAIVDAHAKERGTSRVRMIRRYVAEGLAREGVMSDTEAAILHGHISGEYGDH
jgi:hypothetical protein